MQSYFAFPSQAARLSPDRRAPVIENQPHVDYHSQLQDIFSIWRHTNTRSIGSCISIARQNQGISHVGVNPVLWCHVHPHTLRQHNPAGPTLCRGAKCNSNQCQLRKLTQHFRLFCASHWPDLGRDTFILSNRKSVPWSHGFVHFLGTIALLRIEAAIFIECRLGSWQLRIASPWSFSSRFKIDNPSLDHFFARLKT